MQSDDDYERVYLRPHRAGRYPDAIHYAPSHHGVTGWQLYFGEGYTAGVQLPPGEWIRLRLEFSGSQARLFVGNAPNPALTMDHLARDPAAGKVGLLCAADGSSYCWPGGSSRRQGRGRRPRPRHPVPCSSWARLAPSTRGSADRMSQNCRIGGFDGSEAGLVEQPPREEILLLAIVASCRKVPRPGPDAPLHALNGSRTAEPG
jgi:hypothetical protein